MNRDKIADAVEVAIVKAIQNGDFFKTDYQSRIDLTPELVKTYKAIDYDKIYAKMGELLEEEIARKIVNKIITEMSVDIKKLMANATVRDDLRFFMRKGVERILSKVSENPQEPLESGGE
jgi:hypothetical protein